MAPSRTFRKRAHLPTSSRPDRARRAGLDYLALGDWHGHVAVNTRTHYSGTPEPDRFKHDRPGQALLVSIAGRGAEPQVTPLETGSFAWRTLPLHLLAGDDIEASFAALLPAGPLRRQSVLRIAASGRVRLAGRAALAAAVDRAAPDFAHLELDESELATECESDDLDQIDRAGALREAAEALLDESVDEARSTRDREIAQAALVRLFSYCEAIDAMKLTALRLHNVKRFAGHGVAIEGIGDGVNVLCAANEYGKSTCFEALHALFFQAHTGTSESVRLLRPYSGGSPLVEADIATADGKYRLTKQFYGGKRASVTDLASGRLIAQADEAESFIADLIRGGPAGPAGLLWVRQGVTGIEKRSKSEEDGDKRVRESLLSSVQGEVEALTGGRRMAKIAAACEEELFRLVTATLRPKAGGRYAAALDEQRQAAGRGAAPAGRGDGVARCARPAPRGAVAPGRDRG